MILGIILLNMKKILSFLFLLINISVFSQKIDFNKYFTTQSLRIDYIHGGNSDTAYILLKKLKQEPYWGGTQNNLLDTFFYGEYHVAVYDIAENKKIYSYNFSTLFSEWQLIPEAQHLSKAFEESISVPFPKNKIRVTIEEHQINNTYRKVFELEFDPKNTIVEKGLSTNFEVKQLLNNGDAANKIDMVFIAEGYTRKEMKKFLKSAKALSDSLFESNPFSKHKDKFNVYAILSFSDESGTDLPRADNWKNTILNSKFNTFGVDRYLTTPSYHAIKDIAAQVPYDQICVLVNTEKYGGSGIYNFYNISSANNEQTPEVFIHEFGHGFGGLSDEYAGDYLETSDHQYTQYEPNRPNVTTLKNFNSKWADLVDPETPIPTPDTKKYKNTIGAFEGAATKNKGVYRAEQTCKMKVLYVPFCTICKRSLEQTINFLTDKN